MSLNILYFSLSKDYLIQVLDKYIILVNYINKHPMCNNKLKFIITHRMCQIKLCFYKFHL